MHNKLQHQQQVATAVERAKQVTMTELNAIIGVRVTKNYFINNFSYILPRNKSKKKNFTILEHSQAYLYIKSIKKLIAMQIPKSHHMYFSLVEFVYILL